VTAPRSQITESPEATESLARHLAKSLRTGDLLLLAGDLATGKTTFVRGLLAGLHGDPEEVTSPSFVLVHTYPCRGDGIERLHHVDLYRLADRVSDLRELGLEELLSDAAAVTAVEWPKTMLEIWLPTDSRVWRIRLAIAEGDRRRIKIESPA